MNGVVCLPWREWKEEREEEEEGGLGIANCMLYSDTGGEECVWQAHLWSFERREACWQTSRELSGRPYRDMVCWLWVTWLRGVIHTRLQIRGYVRECVEIKISVNCGLLLVRKKRRLTEKNGKIIISCLLFWSNATTLYPPLSQGATWNM